MELRPYQQKLQQEIFEAWQHGARNVLMVLPTGGGKTLTKSNLIKNMNTVTCCIAHRQELVLQISESLAGQGIVHNIIAPLPVVKFCVERHVRAFGRSFYNAGAPVATAGIKTLLIRKDDQTMKQFFNRVNLWDIDEAHHVQAENQWGTATKLFPNARGLGVTATPLRLDRRGLDGVFDDMVIGPNLRDLIDAGYLSEYRIFCPPNLMHMENIRISEATGEYIAADLSAEFEKSQIVGDIVAHYLRICPGGRGLTFTVDVKSAEKVAAAYNAAGVPAAVVTAQTPDRIRTTLLERLARGDIKQLVNVDLFGEGMDCPTLEVVSMARATQSYGLYVQQFGRVLRRADGKSHGIVIDHVGNVVRHGLPDRPRDWSLSAPEGKRNAKDPDEIPLTTCVECFRPYERIRKACPYCGAVPVPADRSDPKFVDGDLEELSPEVLARMRGEIAKIDGAPLFPVGLSGIAVQGIKNNWRDRQTAQVQLRDCIALWAGALKYGHGATDSEIYRRFYFKFNVDVATAQTLPASEAIKLSDKIRLDMAV